MEERDSIILRAKGHWEMIYNALAGNQLGASMAMADRGKGDGHVPCPVHSPTKDGFRLYPDWRDTGAGVCGTCGCQGNGMKMLMWLFNWDFKQAAEAVEQVLDGACGVSAKTATRNKPQQETEHEVRERKLKELREVYAKTVPLDHPSAEAARMYLVSRHIDTRVVFGVPALRFHAALPFYQRGEDRKSKLLGCFPAIIQVVTDNQGHCIGLHRTYLDHSGAKLGVENPKKLMSSPWGYTGGCVRVQKHAGRIPPVLHLCEGLETGLSVRTVMRVPVWTLIDTALFGSFVPPQGVAEVWIWADKDRPRKKTLGDGRVLVVRPGQDAASALKRRLWKTGFPTRIMYPDALIPHGKDGVDWNDTLVQQGPLAFPGNIAGARRIERVSESHHADPQEVVGGS